MSRGDSPFEVDSALNQSYNGINGGNTLAGMGPVLSEQPNPTFGHPSTFVSVQHLMNLNQTNEESTPIK